MDWPHKVDLAKTIIIFIFIIIIITTTITISLLFILSKNSY